MPDSGNGGTSKTAQAVLETLGAGEILKVSRRPEGDNTISYEECYQIHKNAQVIVNTTPVGMYPNIDNSPLDLTPFTLCQSVVDVIFNPIQTKLTKTSQKPWYKISYRSCYAWWLSSKTS